MNIAARTRRSVLFALAMCLIACGGDSTAPDDDGHEAVVVSLVGTGADDAGIVLRLTGGLDHIEPARPSLDVAWARDEKNATVVIVGRLSEGNDVVLVRRVGGLLPLRAELVEVAATDGGVSSPSTVLATVRRGGP